MAIISNMLFVKKMFKLSNYIPSWLGRKKSTKNPDDVKPLINLIKKEVKEEKKSNKKITTYEYQGNTYKIGDRVICRSNEPHPFWIGKIVEFWDNNGKWSTAVPRVRNLRSGKVWSVNGIIRPMTKELVDTLKTMKPLEQWNYLAPEEAKYTESEMKIKEENFSKRHKLEEK